MNRRDAEKLDLIRRQMIHQHQMSNLAILRGSIANAPPEVKERMEATFQKWAQSEAIAMVDGE